jgi:hypothetical protein
MTALLQLKEVKSTYENATQSSIRQNTLADGFEGHRCGDDSSLHRSLERHEPMTCNSNIQFEMW